MMAFTGSDTAFGVSVSEDTASPSSKQPGRILVVDDSSVVRTTLERYLRNQGYEVCAVDSGLRALEQLRAESFILMLCDIEMPGLSGLEAVPRALEIDPDLAIVMLSSVDNAEAARTALADGAMDYLVKPVKTTALGQALDRAVHRRMLAISQRRTERFIREEVALRTAELEQKARDLEAQTQELERERAALRTITIGVPEMLVAAMEAKDVYLRGHSQRVAALAASIAQEMGLDDDTIEWIRLAGRLQDVGKIGIREAVLNKPGALTPEEYEHIKDHVRLGMEILKPMTHLGPALELIQDHHERYNGKGYPRGRRGDEIPVGALILGAADSFNAMTSQRAYREQIFPEEALRMLERSDPYQLFGPQVLNALRSAVNRRAVLTFIVETPQ